MSRTRIKICGITNTGDAHEALKAGADFLGFNFHALSSRYIKPQRVKGILEFLRMQGVKKMQGVGVFVDEDPEEIRRILRITGLRIVQLHGNETPQDVASLKGFLRIKAVKVTKPEWADQLDRYGADAYLAEAPHATLPGGSGMSYDYSLVEPATQGQKIFLAGGLNPRNVAEAVRLVHPYAVDVASGVESTPGHKDIEAMRAFCQAVRSAGAARAVANPA